MDIQNEPKWAMGSMPAVALHGTLLLVAAVVFAVIAVIRLWQESRWERPSKK
jgi:hypothetical protein